MWKHATIVVLAVVYGFAGLTVAESEARAQQYTKSVELPDCESGDSEVKIIRDDPDWDAINDSSLRVFCVTPGD
ncbi:MAG: hypothetical protein ABEN55_01255, partial [Bradymonadaceae bacterium]